MLSVRLARLNLSDAIKNSNCYCNDGPGPSVAKARSCSFSGEAGIGKSRLAAALLEHLAQTPHTRLRYFCSPQNADSAFLRAYQLHLRAITGNVNVTHRKSHNGQAK